MKKNKLFNYSSKDAVLVLLSLLQVSLYVILAIKFHQLSLIFVVSCGIVQTVLICLNFQCVAHNFIHHPFFLSKWANNAFSIFNSISIGVPQYYYHMHHINHHAFNNTPQDFSSIYLHGKSNRAEGILSYSLLSYFRTDFSLLHQQACENFNKIMIYLQISTIIVFFALLSWIGSWKFMVFTAVCVYLGSFFASFENYVEHFKAHVGDRMRDSVSCYNRVYNLLTFNNGFHQEHHVYPNVHWTQLPSTNKKMLPDSHRRVVNYAHLFNFGGK
ncbi:MAG: fatty acid desaturase family protein [Bacteriovoracales bacterium]